MDMPSHRLEVPEEALGFGIVEEDKPSDILCVCKYNLLRSLDFSYHVYFCRAAGVGDDSGAHCEVSVVRARPPVSSKVLTHAAYDVLPLTLRQL